MPSNNNEQEDTKLCDFCKEIVAAKATRCKHCKATLSNKSTEDNENFSVVREESQETYGSRVEKVTKVVVVLKDEQLKLTLNSYLPNNQKFFDKNPAIPADELFTILPNLKQAVVSYRQSGMTNPIQGLVAFLEKEFEEQARLFEEMKKSGSVTFEYLQFLFVRGMKIYGYEGTQLLGSAITDTTYTRTMFTTLFVISGEVIKSDGEQFFSHNHQFVIPQFRGVKKIEELEVRPMDDDTLQLLSKRGELFNKFGIGSHYLSYKGNIVWKTPHYTSYWKADGRIVIDGNSFNKMNPNYAEFKTPANINRMRQPGLMFHQPESASRVKDIPQSSWYKTWPTLGGFSFSIKKWGEIILSNTMDIKFDDEAFSRLVLDEEKKNLIKGLVFHSDNVFADIISGKGAGIIFLLHGPPGVGKTLTAEAIAELLHRPLYSISVGELGTNTNTLEEKLRDILDVASIWKAVILLDEADIFLEKRNDNDIERNAMTGIFLRLLEYHQGILFLTTNRVQRFDEAFHSRISIALKYHELEEDARNQVWKNFFQVAKITGLPVDELSKHNLNGRQIRTVIRLAQSLAKAENVPISMKHFERTISVTSQFQQDVSL